MVRLLEHHSLELVARSGVAIAPYRVAATPDEARTAAAEFGGDVVVKALVPAGGRGKAGGVRTAKDGAEAAALARQMLGDTLGHFPVDRVLIQARVPILEEYFCAFTFDSSSRGPVALFSAAGGVDVEELVRHRPEALVNRALEPGPALPPHVAREIAESAGLTGRRLLDVATALCRLYQAFRSNDAFLVEVNPLVVVHSGDGISAGGPRRSDGVSAGREEDAGGGVLAPSAVVTVDDQADFRHPEWAEWQSDSSASNGWRPLTPLERRMREIDATDSGSAIRFNEFPEGRIACMMTGGGSGVVTFDHLRRLGETPATTFDITPGRVEEKMYLATKAILSRPGLAGLVAGGNITNFIPIDVKVRGVVRALRELGVDGGRFPIVFRFAGPGVEAARQLAAEVPGIEFYDEALSLEGAMERIVARVREAAA